MGTFHRSHLPILKGRLRQGVAGLVDFFYPPVCPLCWGRLTHEDRQICFRCLAEMTAPFDWECDHCGGAGYGVPPQPERKCRLCPHSESPWAGALSVTGYFEQSARLVHLFKYHRRLELARPIQHMMASRLLPRLSEIENRIDLVVPVPINWLRRSYRGFNQSEQLAAFLATRLQRAYEPRLLRRTRLGRRQALVPREARRQNVEGVFSVTADRRAGLTGRGILLVDDVVTSGETVTECARVLREAGGREVWVACFARAGVGRAVDEEWVDDLSSLSII